MITDDSETKNMVEWVNDFTKDKDYAFVESTEFGLGISEYYFEGKTHYVDDNVSIYVTTNEIFGDVKDLSYEDNNIKEDMIVCLYLDDNRIYQLEKLGYNVVAKRFFNVRYTNYIDVTILERD